MVKVKISTLGRHLTIAVLDAVLIIADCLMLSAVKLGLVNRLRT